MPEFLTTIYLIYSFIAFYILFFFVILYTNNRDKIFLFPKSSKNYSLSIVIPCYNEEKSIGGTIESVLHLDYKNLKKVIVVDDCSTDNSYNIIKKYSAKYKKVVAIRTPYNTGKAAGAKNYGAKFVKTELIGFVDADSYPERDSVNRMIGFFDDKNVAAVTASIFAKKDSNFIEALQAIEYRIIVFTRKLLGFVGAIYVTPGPLAVYRKEYFDKIGGFDEENYTEDIEITWNFLSRGYRVEMSMLSKVYTVVPDNLKDWYKQRVRWNIGGLQVIGKYKKTFAKRGIFGSFVLPFFVISWVLGIFGMAVLIYRFLRRVIINFLVTNYSIKAQTAILSLRDINLTPNVLVFLGAMFLVMSLSFAILALSYTKEKKYRKIKVSNIFIYSFIYLLAYPFIVISSLTKYLRKKQRSWR